MKLNHKLGAALLVGTLASLAAAGERSKAAPVAPAATGSIKGRVVFDGELPKAKPLTINAEQAAGCCDTGGCKGGKVDDVDATMIIDPATKGVANVVVTIEVAGAEKPKVPAEPQVIDQKGCRFHPHVLIVPVGTTVAYANSDAISHNIHTYAVKNEGINLTVAAGKRSEQKLEKAEAVKVTCDIHPWMAGYVFVTEATHWGLSGADGSFEIQGLPPGEYELELWHEAMGKSKQTVTVAEGAAAAVEVKMGEKKARRGRGR